MKNQAKKITMDLSTSTLVDTDDALAELPAPVRAIIEALAKQGFVGAVNITEVSKMGAGYPR
jgi:hypothetical protein